MGYFLLVIAVIVADQLSKWWVVTGMRLYESREIIPGFFNLVYVTNSGAAFSLLADVDSPWRHYFFLVVATAAIIGLTVLYFSIYRSSPWYSVVFGCIVGGAAGNLVDRLRYGFVVDFFDVYIGKYHWPAFNIADSAICIGAAVFIGISFRELQKKKR